MIYKSHLGSYWNILAQFWLRRLQFSYSPSMIGFSNAPTTIQQRTFIRTKDYGLKESNACAFWWSNLVWKSIPNLKGKDISRYKPPEWAANGQSPGMTHAAWYNLPEAGSNGNKDQPGFCPGRLWAASCHGSPSIPGHSGRDMSRMLLWRWNNCLPYPYWMA